MSKVKTSSGKFTQKMTKSKTKTQNLAKTLAAKGAYAKEKASARGVLSKNRLKYKLGKRVAYLTSAELADTQNTIRQSEKERTKRAEIQANRDIALGQWVNQIDGNPSYNGSNGDKQRNSTTENIKNASDYIDKWR